MRNLKRALSLTLASVMLLGMMVVGSSAAAGYDDVAETDNVEAIEVLQAIEVMVGDERGFGPERPVNRAEMAVVMGKLLNLDYNYYEATCPFNDVYDWARGWVGACYANGIVSGRGEGVYDPGTTVTAVEAASMLMRALGYFKYQSDYANGFEVSTVLQANKIRLFDGVNSSTNEPLTRNQVAQMALNALKSGMVEPDGNALNFIDNNGNVIATGGKVNYVYVTSNKSFATAISSVKASSMGSANDSPIVELGEQLYDGKLKLTDTTDVFGRPSRNWEFNAKDIGTYVKKELIKEEYTVKVTGRTLHDLLGSTILKEYNLDVYIDGVTDPDINPAVFDVNSLVRTNDKAVGATGKGVLTQVFVDPDEGANGLITIAVINTYLAIADEDFDDRTDDVDITVYGIEEKVISNQRSEYVKNADNTDNTSAGQSEDFKLETEDFPEIVDVKDGDAFLVNVADGEVQILSKPEILSETQISSFKRGDWIVSGGTQYDFASSAEYECETLYNYTITGTGVVNLKDISYNVYLDKYGYAIGVKEVDRVDNYLFITGLDTNTNNRYAVQADASAIFLDGTMEAIKIDMKAARDLNDQTYNALTNGEKGGSLVNKWFSYTVGSNGIYEVVLVGDYTTVEKTRAGQFRTLTDDETKDFVLGQTDEDKDAKYETYTTGKLVEYYDKSVSGVVTGLGGTHGVDEISRKSIAMRGADTPNSTWYSVYGDDKSVYITAELKTIQDAHNKQTMVNVIGGVDNVAIGIDEASIDVYTKDEALKKDRGANATSPATLTAHGSYVLYDKDGDIIAAVVVGEDAGAVTNLVYTHKDSIESETDNNASSSGSRASVKGDYTWTRKVVSNGEEVLLTEVGSGLSKLKNMDPYTWYVVKYNAKGEVKNVYPAWDTDASYGSHYGNGYKGMISDPAGKADTETVRLEDKYVNNIEELNRATNENSLVLYEVGQYNTGRLINGKTVRSEWDGKAVGNIDYLGGPNTEIVDNLRKSGKPQVDNHTFYITTDTSESMHRGFRVADDVKTVFIQKNNNEWTTTFESGYNRLEKVVNRLHDHDETGRWANTSERNYYHYEISAVMENGKATVVVIRDLNNAGAVITPGNRYYELKLYGNLFTADSHVTGASNAVVVADNREVAPTRVGADPYWGNYTVYSIREGSQVGITDYDIDLSDPRFVCISNMWIKDLWGNIQWNEGLLESLGGHVIDLRYNSRSLAFKMPGYGVWIDGAKGDKAYNTKIYGIVGEKVPGVVTFNGEPAGEIGTLGYGASVKIAISGLEPNTQYTVTIDNEPDFVVNAKKTISNADGVVSFDYYLNGYNLRNGSITVKSVEKVGDEVVKPGVEYVNVTFTGKNFTTVGATKIEKGTSGSITIKAAEGYVITKVGEKTYDKVASATWTYSNIQNDATVAVVTEGKTVVSSDLTVTSGVEATVPAEQVGKALTLTVKGGKENKWYIVTGGDLKGNYCAQADVDGDVMFTYTPSSDKLTITLTETQFMINPLTLKPCLFGPLGNGQNGMIDYEELTIKNMRSRAAVGDVSGNVEGALVSMKLGTEEVYFVNTMVNGKLTLVLTDLSDDDVKRLNEAIKKAETDPETGLVKVELVHETITTDGAAAVSTDAEGRTIINFDMGQPKAVGAKLPTEVTIDGMVTAKVTWSYLGDEIDPNSDDIYAKATEGYTYKVEEPALISGSEEDFPVYVVYPDKAENPTSRDLVEIKSGEDLKKVAVTPKEVITNNVVDEPLTGSELDNVVLNRADGKWHVQYDGNTNATLSEDTIKRLIGNELNGTLGTINLSTGKVTVTPDDGSEKYEITINVSGNKIVQDKMWKVVYNDNVTLDWVQDQTETTVGTFTAAENTLIQGVKGIVQGTALTGAAFDAEGGVKVNTNKDVYLYDAIKLTISGSFGTKKLVYTNAEGKKTDADFTGNAVVEGVTLRLIGDTTTADSYVELNRAAKDGKKVNIQRKLVGADTTATKWDEFEIISRMVNPEDNTITISEAKGVYRVVIEDIDGEWFGTSSGVNITVDNVPTTDHYVIGLAGTELANSYGTLTIPASKLDATNDAADKKDADGTVEVKKAYKLEVEDYVTLVGCMTGNKGDKDPTSNSVADGNYVVPGVTVFVKADKTDRLSCSDAKMGFEVYTGTESWADAARESGAKILYSFTMPEKDVAKTVINKGSSVEFNSENNATVVGGGNELKIGGVAGTADRDVIVKITSSKNTTPTIAWGPYPANQGTGDQWKIGGLTVGEVEVDEDNTDAENGVYVWTVTLTVTDELELGITSRYMIVTVGGEVIPVELATKAATPVSALAVDAAGTQTFAFGDELNAATITAAAGEFTAEDGVWAKDGEPLEAGATVDGPGVYTLTFDVAVEPGYAVVTEGASKTALSKMNTAADGGFDPTFADGKLVYTKKVEKFAPEFTPNTATGTGTAFTLDVSGDVSSAGITAAAPSGAVAGSASGNLTYAWAKVVAESPDENVSTAAKLDLSGLDENDVGTLTYKVVISLGEEVIGEGTITVTVTDGT